MSTKLTLTLDNEVILTAKEYAKNHGISLSKMVEHYFKGISKKIPSDKDDIPPITKELSGYAKITNTKSDKELLVAALESKYL
ncbi:MAG: DUF6364 family protein [Spirochaetia bacterium]|nr:DUF6364 family protein [Spirochaetia bacterium]